MDVFGKLIIVTGASTGIGLATARLLSSKGAKVALAARSKEKLTALSKELPGSIAIPTDMTDFAAVRAMVEKTASVFSRIDGLVNNAGQGYDASIEKTDIGTFRKIFDLDVLGPLVAMQAVIPHMKKNGGGSIVNISSGTALMALPNMAAYSSAKRALVGISLTAREELAKDKIVVSVVYPFITATDFEKNTIRSGPAPKWESADPWMKPDSAELVAGKILEAMQGGAAEVYSRDRMASRGK